MKIVIFIIIISSLSFQLTSCSTAQNNQPITDRQIASSEGGNCKPSSSPDITENMSAICLIANDYLKQLLGSENEFEIIMNKTFHDETKRHVLSLSISTKRENLDTIIGRGGLRIKYLRFLLNELSFEQSRKEYESEKKEHEAIYNFTLVELNLSAKSK
jgi:hypothetical protein